MQTDVVIVGGGPGGCTTSLFLEQRGISSVIVEQAEFPRFHIGESMTGEAGAIVRRLGLEATMKARSYPVKFATEVYGTGGNNKFRVPVMARGDEGLNRASTWQVRRSDFDAILFEAAIERGATHVTGKAQKPIVDADGRVTGVSVELPEGDTLDIEAQMVVDASGRGTWASRAGLTGPKDKGNYAKQTAIFSHVRGAVRDEGDDSGNTIIFYKSHLHWGWFIPIDDEVTSIGIVAPNKHFQNFSGTVEEYYDEEVATLNPELARRLDDAEQVEPVRSTANFSYEVTDYVGEGFMCVGDSHRFIDPIFSFGLYITMAEAEKAASVIADVFAGSGDDALGDYAAFTQRGQDNLQNLVDGFWTNPLAFGYMVHHSEYADDFIDLFAGRIYDEAPNPAITKLGTLIANSA